MGATKDLFIRISEEEYFSVPEDIRERHLRSKIYSESIQDFDWLMQDETYSSLHKEYKKNKQALEQRAYDLREQKRKQLNK